MSATPAQVGALEAVVADRRRRLAEAPHPEAARAVLAECEATLDDWTRGPA